MASEKQARVIVDLDSPSEPISGQIQEGDGPRRPFVGWLALAAALRRALGNAADDSEPTGERSD